MKTLIIYATAHGCTEKCAVKVKEGLNGDAVLVNIKKAKVPEIDSFDAVVIGGSIHAGAIQKRVKKFCQKHTDALLATRLGLFLCCMEEGENAQAQFENAFPQNLRDHASAEGLFGGEFDFDRMKAIEKAIVKKVAGVDSSVSKISEENIQTFIDAMNA